MSCEGPTEYSGYYWSGRVMQAAAAASVACSIGARRTSKSYFKQYRTLRVYLGVSEQSSTIRRPH